MLKRASSMKEETCQLEEEAQHLEMEGLAKLEVAVTGSEAGGFYGLLRGAIAHPSTTSASPPPKKVHHAPSSTVSCPPPQEPTGVTPEASKPVTNVVEQASEGASPA